MKTTFIQIKKIFDFFSDESCQRYRLHHNSTVERKIFTDSIVYNFINFYYFLIKICTKLLQSIFDNLTISLAGRPHLVARLH